MSRPFSINLGDVLVGVGCAYLVAIDKPLPSIVILLAMVLSELARIRTALEKEKAS